MAHKSENGNVQVFDVTVFLWHARCFAALTRPVVKLIIIIYAIISWKSSRVTFVSWLLINITTVIVPTGYTLVLFILGLIISCGLGVLHHHTRIFIKLFPDHELEASALQAYLHRSWSDEQKILQEYRNVLVQIDSLLASSNARLEQMYNILKWDNPRLSLSVNLLIATFSLVLYLFDLRATVFVANNLILLGSGIYLHKYGDSFKRSLKNDDSKVEIKEEEEEETKLETEESDVEDLIIVDEEEQDSSESTETTKPNLEETGSTTSCKRRTNVVKKLMELRRSQHQVNAGTCTGCQAAFMSILKRKYICCNCGNHFCSRCCSLKVPKSFLGVTAPSTKNDTVLLCGVCHRYLMAKSNALPH